jgi:gamma-glutamylcyclotransferase
MRASLWRACPYAGLSLPWSFIERRTLSVHYFAYGSNMNWPQMQRRCPSSKFVCVARLAGYQFGITRHSRLRDCGTANVFPGPGKEVWGVVYDVGVSELLILDSFEDGYRRTIMPVYALGDGVQPLASLIYIAEIESNVPPPNAEYKRLILEGARHWNLPESYCLILEKIEALTVP